MDVDKGQEQVNSNAFPPSNNSPSSRKVSHWQLKEGHQHLCLEHQGSYGNFYFVENTLLLHQVETKHNKNANSVFVLFPVEN